MAMDVDCPSLEAILDGLRRAVQATAAEKDASGASTPAELDLISSLSHLATISRLDTFAEKDLPAFLQGHGLGLLVDVLTREVRDMRYVRGARIGRSGLEVARTLGIMLADSTAKGDPAPRRVWETKPDEGQQLMTILVDVLEKRYKEHEPTLHIMRVLHALVCAAVGPKSLQACVKCFANDRRIRMLCRILSQYFPRPSTPGVAVRFVVGPDEPCSPHDGMELLLVWLELVHALLLLGAWTPERPPQHLLAVSYDATQSSRVHYVVEGIPPALLAPRRQARILYHRTRMAWKDSFAKYFSSAGLLLDGTPALEWALHVTCDMEQTAVEDGDARQQGLAAYLVDVIAEASHSLAMLAKGREGFCQSLMLAHMERLALMLARPVDASGSSLGPIMPLLKFLTTETRPKLVSCYVLGDKPPPAPPKPAVGMFAAKSPQALDMELAAGAPVQMGARWLALLESLLASVEAVEGIGSPPPADGAAQPAAARTGGMSDAGAERGGGDGCAAVTATEELCAVAPGSLASTSAGGPGRTGLSLDAVGCERLYRLIGFLHLCGMGTAMERGVWSCSERSLGARLVWVMLRALTMMCPMAGGEPSRGSEGGSAGGGASVSSAHGAPGGGEDSGVSPLAGLRYQLAVDAACLLSSASRADPLVRAAVTRFLGGNPADAPVMMATPATSTAKGGGSAAPLTSAANSHGGATSPVAGTHTVGSPPSSLSAGGGSLLRLDSLGAHLPAKNAGGAVAKSPLIAFNAQLLKPYDEGAVSDTEGTPGAAVLRGTVNTPFSPTRTNMQPVPATSATTPAVVTPAASSTINGGAAGAASTLAPSGASAPPSSATVSQGRAAPDAGASSSSSGTSAFPPIRTAAKAGGVGEGMAGSSYHGGAAASMDTHAGAVAGPTGVNVAHGAVMGRDGAPGNAAKGATPNASQGAPAASSSPRHVADARASSSPQGSSLGSGVDSDGGTPHKSGHSKRNKMHKHPVASGAPNSSAGNSVGGGNKASGVASVSSPIAPASRGQHHGKDGAVEGMDAASVTSPLSGPLPMSVSSGALDGMEVTDGRSSDSVSSPMLPQEAARDVAAVTAAVASGVGPSARGGAGSKGLVSDREMRAVEDELAVAEDHVELEMTDAL